MIGCRGCIANAIGTQKGRVASLMTVTVAPVSSSIGTSTCSNFTFTRTGQKCLHQSHNRSPGEHIAAGISSSLCAPGPVSCPCCDMPFGCGQPSSSDDIWLYKICSPLQGGWYCYSGNRQEVPLPRMTMTLTPDILEPCLCPACNSLTFLSATSEAWQRSKAFWNVRCGSTRRRFCRRLSRRCTPDDRAA